LKQFFRFCLVGALGFVTDFGVLYLGVKVLGLGTVIGRILSFIVAATVTWKANRHFTFVQQGQGSMREWLHYLLLTSVGGGINVVVYQIWLWFTDHSTLNLFLAVAAGSAVALLFNFAISKRMVFAKPELPL
jgi:putative flippase GtrA